MLAARPVAIRMQSAVTSAGGAPSGPTVRRIPSSPTTSEAASKRALVMTVIPRRSKLRWRATRDLAVLERHDGGQVLDQGHGDAEVVECGGELGAHGARPDDHDARRQLGHAQHVVGGQDPPAVRHDPGQGLHARAGREDDVGRLEEALAARAGRAVGTVEQHADAARPVEAAATRDPLDLVLARRGS